MRKLTFLLSALATGLAVAAVPAEAAFVYNFTQSGKDVIGSGSGTINFSGLTFVESSDSNARGVVPSLGLMVSGGTGMVYRIYSGLRGPSNFGLSGGAASQFTLATTSSGDTIGIDGPRGHIGLPDGLGSDSDPRLLTSSMTFANATFESLGLKTGSYVYQWGKDEFGDSFTINIGASQAGAVPEPATWAMMIGGMGAIGGTLRSRRRKLALRLA